MAPKGWGASGRGKARGGRSGSGVAPADFHAVRIGRTPGVYSTWAAAKAEIDHPDCPPLPAGEGRKYMKFRVREQAVEFVGGEDVLKAWGVRPWRVWDAQSQRGEAESD
eukprot:SAG31_NODE_1804_length_7234_cov_3.340855_6_plen_109_part_00